MRKKPGEAQKPAHAASTVGKVPRMAAAADDEEEEEVGMDTEPGDPLLSQYIQQGRKLL